MKIRFFFCLLLCWHPESGSPAQTDRAFPAATPKGIYRFDDGSFATFFEMEGFPAVIFPDGNIRGLRPDSVSGMTEYGNAIGRFDSIGGRLRFDRKGNTLTLTTAGETKMGTKVALREQDMRFKNGRVRLGGTLILPPGKGPFSCVVLTHGSGQETREASRGLAYLFAGHGIAAFIYDKRGSKDPDSDEWKAPFSDYAADAIIAAEILAKNKDIDPKRMGIYGHSQGGWVAPLAASRSGLFSFVIISAGNAVNPVEQHLYNGMCINRQNGVPEHAIREIYEFRRIKYEAGITGDSSRFNLALPAAQSKPWFVRTGGTLPTGKFWKANGYYDPEPALRALICPVLVLAGELDKYTDTRRNMSLFKEIFQKSGNERVTYTVFPSANHALLHTPTGRLDETEIMELKKFADGYFETLTGWVKEVVKEETLIKRP